MSFIKSCYGNIGKWRSTMFTWPPVVLFIYLQSFTTLPLTVKIVGEIVVPFELENAVSNYPSLHCTPVSLYWRGAVYTILCLCTTDHSSSVAFLIIYATHV